MKLNTLIPVVALLISIASIVYTFKTKTEPVQVAIDQAAEKALLKREKQLVDRFRDRFYTMYAGQNLGVNEDWNPQDLEELFAPTMKMINDLGE